jgi:hypothetical protein
MCDQKEAWDMYVQLELVAWHVLPSAGGLLDQDDVLMENIFRIKYAVERLKAAQ